MTKVATLYAASQTPLNSCANNGRTGAGSVFGGSFPRREPPSQDRKERQYLLYTWTNIFFGFVVWCVVRVLLASFLCFGNACGVLFSG